MVECELVPFSCFHVTFEVVLWSFLYNLIDKRYFGINKQLWQPQWGQFCEILFLSQFSLHEIFINVGARTKMACMGKTIIGNHPKWINETFQQTQNTYWSLDVVHSKGFLNIHGAINLAMCWWCWFALHFNYIRLTKPHIIVVKLYNLLTMPGNNKSFCDCEIR